MRRAQSYVTSGLAAIMRRCAAAMWRDENGSSAVEFAFVGPIMIMMMVSGTQLGIAFYNKNALMQVATQGVRIFSESRSVSTTPYTDTTTAITTALSGYTTLTAASVTKTIKSNGTTCTDNTCSMTAGQSAQVTLSYPCISTTWNIYLWTQIDVISNCTLTATATMRIE
jgi:Flp pilus assembly protein TadG